MHWSIPRGLRLGKFFTVKYAPSQEAHLLVPRLTQLIAHLQHPQLSDRSRTALDTIYHVSLERGYYCHRDALLHCCSPSRQSLALLLQGETAKVGRPARIARH